MLKFWKLLLVLLIIGSAPRVALAGTADAKVIAAEMDAAAKRSSVAAIAEGNVAPIQSPPPPYFGTNPSFAAIKAKLLAAGKKYDIPPHILFGIAFAESGWNQFLPDGRTKHRLEPNGTVGVGIMQMTVSPSVSDYARLCTDIDYNIDRGAALLGDPNNRQSKWNISPAIGGNFGNIGREKLENWYYAVWAYNGLECPNRNNYAPKVFDYIANGQGLWTPVSITKPGVSPNTCPIPAIPNTPTPTHIDANYDGVIDGSVGGSPPETGHTFGRPIGGASIVCTFNDTQCAAPGKYHTAVDYGTAYGRTVSATNCGTVAAVTINGQSDSGMGNTVIVEHILTTGQKIYSLYAHLASIDGAMKAGAKITKGQRVGEMGGTGYGKSNHWEVHLHFELKTAPVLHNPSGSGKYWGYTPSPAQNFGYLDPGEYIPDNPKYRAVCPDSGGIAVGQGSSRQQLFRDAYNRNGASNMGNPTEPTRWAYNHPVVVQEFNGGAWGGCTIFDDEAANIGAFVLRHGMRDRYYGMGGADSVLGAPRSDERVANPSPYGTTGAYQGFARGSLHAGPRGIFWIINQISNKYGALDGSGGVMGFPLSDEFEVVSARSSIHGWVNVFEGGHIFHTNELGTYATKGDINRRYAGMGSMDSILGFPTSDERLATTSPYGTTGAVQSFEAGAIHTSAKGAFWTINQIHLKYGALEGSGGFMGFPISDEIESISSDNISGWHNQFEGGTIWHTNELGTHFTKGGIHEKYTGLGAMNSVLGYPSSDEIVVSTDHYRQVFHGGAIYSRSQGTWVVHGGINTAYNVAGAWNGIWGWPLRDQNASTSSKGTAGGAQDFDNGTAFTSSRGNFFVSGAIKDKYADQGWERGILGYPTSDAYAYRGGLRQDFEGGSLTNGALQLPIVVSITPASVLTNDKLTATVTGAGEDTTLAYTWKKNGVVIAGQTAVTLDLSKPGHGDKGDVILCEVTATNASGGSATASAQVTVQNSTPIAISSKGEVPAATEKAFVLNAYDADGDALTYKRVGGPRNGVTADIRVDPADGKTKLFYKSRPFYGGVDIIRFVVFDSSNKQSNESTLGINVLYTPPPPANRAPIAGDTNIDTYVGDSVVKGLLGSDPDGDAITFRIVGNAKYGTSEIKRDTDGFFKLFYTSLNRFYGSDSVTYLVTDSRGKESNLATVRINFINRSPVALGNFVQVASGESVSQFLFADDPDLDAITFRLVNNPRFGKGEVKLDPQGKWRFFYRSLPGYVGPDQITFIAIDPFGKESSVAAIDINVVRVSPPGALRSKSEAPSGDGS